MALTTGTEHYMACSDSQVLVIVTNSMLLSVAWNMARFSSAAGPKRLMRFRVSCCLWRRLPVQHTTMGCSSVQRREGVDDGRGRRSVWGVRGKRQSLWTVWMHVLHPRPGAVWLSHAPRRQTDDTMNDGTTHTPTHAHT